MPSGSSRKSRPGRVGQIAGREATLKRLRGLARLMDSRFEIGGIRFGLDGLIGLIPGIGDAATFLIGAYIVLEAARLKAPISTRLAMAGNLLVDFFGGSVPLVGDLFDFAFKANQRNIDLLMRHLETLDDAEASRPKPDFDFTRPDNPAPDDPPMKDVTPPRR